MSTSLTELIEQLAEVNTRNDARQQLLRQGTQAIPALLEAAAHASPPHYRAILEVLSELKDPRAEGLFRQALAGDDPEARAAGARGLYLLNVPDALDALRLTINDAPDPLHFEQTPAASLLIASGMPALPTIFTLMESPDETTRQRAQHALASIVLRDITRQLQPRPLTNDALSAWEKLQEQNGSYRWDAPEPARRASIDRWKRWFQSQSSQSGSS